MSHALASWEGEGDVDRLGRGGVDRGHLRAEVKTRDEYFAETVENVDVITVITIVTIVVTIDVTIVVTIVEEVSGE